MKPRASILVTLFAGIVSLVGLVLTIGALAPLRTVDGLHRLLTYDYVSFVDGATVGGMVSDFFVGVALLLVGSVLFTKVDRVRRYSRLASGILFLFIALTLVYACISPRIGIRPY